jgi:glucosamine-6-phosphate deaminase
MNAVFFDHVNLPPARAHMPDGRAKNWRREIARYEDRIARAGGLDLVILGVGGNGHLGFNEPGPALHAHTHRVALLPETRRANAHLFGGRWQDVPSHALSMGIGTILTARHVVLLATGASKARVVARALSGPITTHLPASLLQIHPNVVVVLDRDAASGLPARRR